MDEQASAGPARPTCRARVLAALRGQPVERPPIVNPTSVATIELMRVAGASFPEAHHEAVAMAQLAAAGHSELGFDCVMPVFSIVQEASALGCPIDWGGPGDWPTVREPIWHHPDDISIPDGFMDHPDIQCVLAAIRALRRQFGSEVAVLGKVMGPCTLSYSTFGLESFLVMSIDDPSSTAACLARLKDVTIEFALAQMDAGADAVTVADHATGDLVSAAWYRRYLKDIHSELAARLPGPLILHICGRTLDRMADIADTGFAAFHFDSKNPAVQAVNAAGGRIALIGNINNPVTLLRGEATDVRAEVAAVLAAGVELVGPECAVPLNVPTENLREIGRSVRELATPPVAQRPFTQDRALSEQQVNPSE